MSTESVSSNALTALMVDLNHYFPVPVPEGFLGHHHFILNDAGFLELGMWVEVEGKTRCYSIVFNEGDESIDSSWMEKNQTAMAEFIKNETRPDPSALSCESSE